MMCYKSSRSAGFDQDPAAKLCACKLMWICAPAACKLKSLFFVCFVQAKLMFDGEMASLEAIGKTETVKVPKPVKVIELDRGGCVFVMEHLDMRGLSK